MQFELVGAHEAGSSVEADSLYVFGCHDDVCGLHLVGGHPLEEGLDQLIADASTLVGPVDGNCQELDAPARSHGIGGAVPEGFERPTPSAEKASQGAEGRSQSVAQEKGTVEAPQVGATCDESHNLPPLFGYEKE